MLSTVRRTALCTLIFTAAACDSGDREAPAVEASTPSAVPAQPSPDDAVDGDAGQPDSERLVIRRASVRLRANAPRDVIAAATRLAENAGGYVAGSSSNGVGDDVQQVDATLRIPADRFESVLQTLRTEGELLHESLSGEDVTEQYTDLSARLRSKRALEERLLTILSRVDSVEDALKVEAELTDARTEIERLDASVQNMERQVAMATIELSVGAAVQRNAADAETAASRLDRALDDAGRAFFFVIGALIRMIGFVLPLAALGLPIGLASRHAIARRRRQQLPPR